MGQHFMQQFYLLQQEEDKDVTPATKEEVFKNFSKSPKKSCTLNPIPAGFLIDSLPTLLQNHKKIITFHWKQERYLFQ